MKTSSQSTQRLELCWTFKDDTFLFSQPKEVNIFYEVDFPQRVHLEYRIYTLFLMYCVLYRREKTVRRESTSRSHRSDSLWLISVPALPFSSFTVVSLPGMAFPDSQPVARQVPGWNCPPPHTHPPPLFFLCAEAPSVGALVTYRERGVKGGLQVVEHPPLCTACYGVE